MIRTSALADDGVEMDSCIKIGIGIAFIILLYLLAIMPRMIKRPSFKQFYLHYYAHRGFYDNKTQAAENTMRAFRAAIERGYGIELDVQLTKDNIAVVFHDEKLNRVCGVEGKLKDYTYKELQQFKLYSSSERIPRLKEVLTFVNGQVPLIVEIKCEDGNTLVCKYAYELLKDYKGVYCVESFHPFVLFWFRRNANNIIRGQLASNFFMAGDNRLIMKCLGDLIFNFFGKPDFIAYDCLYVNSFSRQICRRLYKSPAAAWTVSSQKQLNKVRREYDLFIFEGFKPE